jgi:hypothetical protein
MNDLGHACDAEGCERPATKLGFAEVPVRPMELALCDEHIEALRAGKLLEISQDPLPDGSYGRPEVAFSE